MTTYRRNSGDGLRALFRDLTRGRQLNRGALWGMIILVALVAFEVSNFNATRFALQDILGGLSFGRLQWATILAIAFCGIDFAGIARVFTPEQGADEPKEVYYLFGAWLLAAGFNAILTWWGVSIAIINHASASGGAVISNETLTKFAPIFVAAMILLIRVMLIGSFALSGDRMFSTAESSRGYSRPASQQTYRPATQSAALRPASSLNRPAPTMQGQSYRPATKPAQQASFTRVEPTYHSFSDSASERSYDA
ncbi:MAG: hypothetical protein OZ914_02025 [Anaerolineaceae bacterium]|nr:hypothetical protein [Anaerolineaceae bacterium]OQY90692.1 MAG: hypothetical protein B6D38_02885 [Anaerolineae bacterium UTCFX1]